MAKNEIKKSNGTIGGNGLATAGLVLGISSSGWDCAFALW